LCTQIIYRQEQEQNPADHQVYIEIYRSAIGSQDLILASRQQQEIYPESDVRIRLGFGPKNREVKQVIRFVIKKIHTAIIDQEIPVFSSPWL
jgi:hypothetical protein